MIVVVSDTSPIRALNHLSLLPVLERLFGSVLITPAVESELLISSSRFEPFDVSKYDFIEVRAPRDNSKVDGFRAELDLGEAEALALALEVGAGIVLMDEKAGRKLVVRHNIVALGTVGVLLRAKKRGLVEAVMPLLDRLTDEINFHLSHDLKIQASRLAGEESIS